MARMIAGKISRRLVLSNELFSIGTMPGECTMYVDGKRPENCQVMFDANVYEPKEVRALLDRYRVLLESCASAPDLPMGKLFIVMGPKPMRWTYTWHAKRIYESLKFSLGSFLSLEKMRPAIRKSIS
jgi:hypothetical protein